MIPIHFQKTDEESPYGGTHFVMAANGLFVRKKEWWVDALAPVLGENLAPVAPFARLLLPPLPAKVTAQSLALAKKVFDFSRSEVCLLLHYHPETGYVLTVPVQDVGPAAIQYHPGERVPGALCVGTIHSHGVFEAGHSRTDLDDEEEADGVHVTLGNMEEYPNFSLSAEIAVNGARFPVNPEWFEGLLPFPAGRYRIESDLPPDWEVPQEWLLKVNDTFVRRPPRRKL